MPIALGQRIGSLAPHIFNNSEEQIFAKSPIKAYIQPQHVLLVERETVETPQTGHYSVVLPGLV